MIKWTFRQLETSLLAFILIAGLVGLPAMTAAHSPHDVIDTIALSPTFSEDSVLFAVSADHLLRSSDGGYEWKELVNGLDNKFNFSSIAVSPFYRRDGLVYVSSDGDGIYRSRDGGDSWETVNGGLDRLRIGLVYTSPGYENGGVLLAAGVEGGLYRALLTEVAWQPVNEEATKVTAIGFSPDLACGVVVAGDDQGNIWLSEDAGKTWQIRYRLEEAGRIMAVAVSDTYSQDRTFFIGTELSGMFRTIDGGESFHGLQGGPSEESFYCAEGRRPSTSGKHVMSIALAPDYGKNRTVYATTWYDAVYMSDDGGETWDLMRQGISCDKQADSPSYRSPHFRDLKMSVDGDSPGTLFLAGFDGLFKSADAGTSWLQSEIFSVGLIKGLAVSPINRDGYSMLITSYGGGAYKSEDGGRTWHVSNGGLKTTRLVDITFSPDFANDQSVFSGASGALLRSIDGGNSWQMISLNSKESSWRIRIGRYLSKFGVAKPLIKSIFGETRKSNPYPTDIVLSPKFGMNQTLYFGTRKSGLFQSPDAGSTSAPIWNGYGRVILGLVLSPAFDLDGTMFASIRGMGIFKSEDKGLTWRATNQGLAFIKSWDNPGGQRLHKKDALLAVSPAYYEDQTLFAGSSNGDGLYKSIDGGVTWAILNVAGAGKRFPIAGLGISPAYKNDATIIVSTKGYGLFRSKDGGDTFHKIGDELIKENHSIELIEFSPKFHIDQLIFAASDESLFRSSDRGESWIRIKRPVRYEDMREVVRYEGPWKRMVGINFSAGTESVSSEVNSSAHLEFIGTGVMWLGSKGKDRGIAAVYVDDEFKGDVDQFAVAREVMANVFSVSGLDFGHHKILIRVSEKKNDQSKGSTIAIDAFDVLE